jgi:multidrug/hemolysin transport system ATP-binding protein
MGKFAGNAEICGSKIGRENSQIRRKIGVVFQENCLDNLLTVKQNLIS